MLEMLYICHLFVILLELYQSAWFEYGFGNDSEGGIRCPVLVYVFGFTIGVAMSVVGCPMLLFVARFVMLGVFLLLRGGPCCLRGEI